MRYKFILFALMPLIISPLSSCGETNHRIKGEAIKNVTDNNFTLEEFKDVSFIAKNSSLEDSNGEKIIKSSLKELFIADVNNDGYRDFCANLSIGSGIVDKDIFIYDYKNKNVLYELSDGFDEDYRLTLDKKSHLLANKYQYDDLVEKGYLNFINGETQIVWNKDVYQTNGIKCELFLYDSGALKELATETLNGVTSYIINTFSTFALKVTSTNNHNEELFKYKLLTNQNSYLRVGNSYEHEDGSIVYLINFRINSCVVMEPVFKLMGFEFKFSYKIDDNHKCWDPYKQSMENVFTWLKPLNTRTVKEICLEKKPGSIAPGSIYPIYYSSDESAIFEFLKFKNKILVSTKLEDMAEGSGFTHYRFYTDDDVHEIRYLNSYVRYGNVNYKLFEGIDDSFVIEHSEKYLKILVYSGYHEVYKSNNPNKKFYINFLKDLEFIEWPSEESYEEVEASFIINDHKAVSSEMKIYSPTRFSMEVQGKVKMFKVTSSINFESFF